MGDTYCSETLPWESFLTPPPSELKINPHVCFPQLEDHFPTIHDVAFKMNCQESSKPANNILNKMGNERSRGNKLLLSCPACPSTVSSVTPNNLLRMMSVSGTGHKSMGNISISMGIFEQGVATLGKSNTL